MHKDHILPPSVPTKDVCLSFGSPFAKDHVFFSEFLPIPHTVAFIKSRGDQDATGQKRGIYVFLLGVVLVFYIFHFS